MASDPPSSNARETFEDIDWEEAGAGLGLSARDKGLLATLVAMLAVFAYDYFVVPAQDPMFDFELPVVHTAFKWDISQLDWLFALTLVLMFFYVVVPLYRNKRLTRYYWNQFRKNRLAVVSLWYLIAILVLGIVLPAFLHKPELALTKQYQPPVFLTVDSSTPIQCLGQSANGLCHGTWAHPLGTTSQGKDILVLIIYGMQVSMEVGLIATLLVITIGTVVGTVAAYAGGLVDEVLMRYVDIQLVFPSFLLFLLLSYLFGGSLLMFILIFGLTDWGGIARLVRAEALQLNEEEYIMAADNAGAKAKYIIRRHFMPNVSGTVITAATLSIPSYILFQAALAFLSLGDPSAPSWGQVIASGRNDLSSAWWISTFPGFFLFFTILAFNFVGDALRDALDPRTEN